MILAGEDGQLEVGDETVEKYINNRINEKDSKYTGWFCLGVALLVVLFVVAEYSMSWNNLKNVAAGIAALVFAVLAVFAGMFEIRVKRISGIIEQVKVDQPSVARHMSEDPWVVGSREVAEIFKYLSLLAIFIATILAIK